MMKKIPLFSGAFQGSCFLTFCCFLVGLSVEVAAQGAGSGDSYVGSAVLEEVIVTVRKREENLQDTPVAVSAFSGDALELRGLRDISGLQDVSPNMTFLNSSPLAMGTNSVVVFIRGVGQADFAPTTDPGVGIYLDGVYFGRSTGSLLSLVDFQRVEVLRGPQGTLFGRNTIGGAVNVTTVRPHDEFEGKLEATVGSDDRLDVKGAVNIPFSDTFFARVSVARMYQDGFVEHSVTGKDLGDTDRLGGRIALRWAPNDTWDLNWTFDYSEADQNGRPEVGDGFVLLSPAEWPAPTGNYPYANNVTFGFLSGCDGTPANRSGSLTNPRCANNQYKGVQAGVSDNFFDNIETWGTTLRADWDINDNLRITSITSYREIDSHIGADADNSPIFIFDALEDLLDHDQVTQEFQLLGSSFDDRLEWVVGGYYFREEAVNGAPISWPDVDFEGGGSAESESIAAFGQATWRVTDRWRLTAGMRYSDESKSFLPNSYIIEHRVPPFLPFYMPPGFPLLPPVEVEVNVDEFTPLVSLSFDATDDLMAYFSYSEGFKGGGFHQRAFPPLPATPTYLPEFVKTYELGWKYQGLDSRLRLNGAIFYSDYQDIQLTRYDGPAPAVDNGGEATLKGVEVEMLWIPVQGWVIEGAVGYLDAEYDSVIPASGLRGSEDLPFKPDVTASVSITKTFTLGGALGTLAPRIDWSYRSTTEFNPFNLPGESQDAYSLLNAGITWDSLNHHSLILAVSNLNDERYSTFLGASPIGHTKNVLGREREWRLTYRFQY